MTDIDASVLGWMRLVRLNHEVSPDGQGRASAFKSKVPVIVKPNPGDYE